jgi:hypothetical protein
MGDRLCDSRIDGGLVVDIEGQRENEVAIGVDERLQRLDVARRGRNTVAARKRRFGPDPAKALGRAGDQPDFARHVFTPWMSPRYPKAMPIP